MAASPGFATASATQRETYPAFLAQVSHVQVRTAVLVPKNSTLRTKLKRGGHYVVKYPAADKRRLLELLHKRHVHVSFARPHGKHHGGHIRRRYLALAVVGLGALASAGWFLTRRRPGQ